MENFEPRIMPYVRQKVEADKKRDEFRRKREALLTIYREIDRLFGKPLSAFSFAKIVSYSCDKVVFTIDMFTFKYRYYPHSDRKSLYVKSKKWYRRWYNLDYSAARFKELVDKGKI